MPPPSSRACVRSAASARSRATRASRSIRKKGVLWALNALPRRGPAVARATARLRERLATSGDKTAAWLTRNAKPARRG
jgi:hypothetical protein